MSFIISYDVYHDNGTLDPHVFPSKDAAATYIQALPHDAKVLPDGYDFCATIYEVGSDALTEVESWWLSALHWKLPEGESLWVLGYEAYKDTERRERENKPPVPQVVAVDGYQALGATSFDNGGVIE